LKGGNISNGRISSGSIIPEDIFVMHDIIKKIDKVHFLLKV
jgi:hypothetical protein